MLCSCLTHPLLPSSPLRADFCLLCWHRPRVINKRYSNNICWKNQQRLRMLTSGSDYDFNSDSITHPPKKMLKMLKSVPCSAEWGDNDGYTFGGFRPSSASPSPCHHCNLLPVSLFIPPRGWEGLDKFTEENDRRQVTSYIRDHPWHKDGTQETAVPTSFWECRRQT